MKILNLFAGIGGNRTLWGDDHEITAVDDSIECMNIYEERFPNDHYFLVDAYDYLETYYSKFDFIWASPPCTTHSQLNRWHKNKRIPDMRLYGIIIFLRSWSKSFWCVENVFPYYHALIKPTARVGRHLLWANFPIKNLDYNGCEIPTGLRKGNKKSEWKFNYKENNDQMNPQFGKHILDSIPTDIKTLEEWIR